MFVGRKKELKQLNNAFKSKNKELGVIYGRRRIGKTKLIDHFVSDKPHLFFQAKEDSSYGNLRSFSYELNKLMSLPIDFVYSSWQAALDSLSGYFNPTIGKGQKEVYDLFESGELTTFEIEFPESLGAKWGFKGVVTAISTSAPMEDNIPFEASIKVSGKPTLTIS